MGTASFGAATPPSNIAEYLKTPTGTVYIASNTPVVGQVLIATSATNATWQTPSAYTTINDLRIQGNTTNTATAAGTLSVALGRNTYAGGTNSITLGPNTVTGTSTSVVVGNACSTVARSGASNGDSCVIVGSGSIITNAGGPGAGATFDYNISIGANNQSLYQAGNSQICNNNTLIGPSNTLTLAHNNNFRRNFMFTQGHDITTSNAHSAAIQDNIIMGREGSYTSDGTLASNNVVIGTVPRWSGCNNSVIIGPTNNAAVKTSVVIGSANNVPATAGTNLFLIGNNANITGTSTNCILIGQGVAALSAADSICIGNGAGTNATGSVVIGNGCTSSGAASIVVGEQNSYSTRPTCVVIGSAAIAEGSGSSSICIGTNAYSNAGTAISIGYTALTSATNGIAIGNGAAVGASSSGSIGIGNSAVIPLAVANAIQLGTGTNGAANSLKFRGSQLHDGSTPLEGRILYKDTTAGNYRAGIPYNMTVQQTGPFTGVVAGRSGDPNATIFSDYDPNYDRTGLSFAGASKVTGISNGATFYYRDGVNFVQGYPNGQKKINGWDQGWGCNTVWRYASCRTDGAAAGNPRVFIPVMPVPLSHYCHMELTITAMRVSNYSSGSNSFTGDDRITAGVWDDNASLIGGRTWSGVAATMVRGDGTAQICEVNNNWGGSSVASDPSLIIRSTAGILDTGYGWIKNNIIEPAVGIINDVDLPTYSFTDTADILMSAGDNKGFSRFATTIGAFGDYEIKGLGVVKINSGATQRRHFGIYVNGKANHLIDWRVIARCTVVPFADPAYPGP